MIHVSSVRKTIHFLYKTALLLLLAFPVASYAQISNCNLGNTSGEIPVGSSCDLYIWDISNNSDYWDAASGCGATDQDDVWAWFVAEASSTTISYAPFSSFDPIVHVFEAPCSATMAAIACSNNTGVDGTETVVVPTVVGQTYMVRIQAQGTNADQEGDLCVFNNTAPPVSGNETCAQPDPICSGSPITFTANTGEDDAEITNPGNDYDCLFSSPNPSWYYLEIDQPGNLVIDVTAGSDVDYAIWGPFASLAAAQASCNSYGAPEDCSYSPSEIEQAVVNSVASGEVYVLLVTNYANTVQTININEAGTNTASTNCGIVPLPVGYSVWDLSVVQDNVILMWETESEQNNAYFAVQRSQNGLVWETIGVVAGKGNSDVANAYSFRDINPHIGVGYYRLMQVDTDGNTNLTSILSANTMKAGVLSVYPNPTSGDFTVRMHLSEIDELFLTDLVGKSYYLPYTESAQGTTVECEGLVSGMYTVTVISNGSKAIQRVNIR